MTTGTAFNVKTSFCGMWCCKAPACRDAVFLLRDHKASIGTDREICRGMIVRNTQPDLDSTGFLFLDLDADYSLFITDIMFQHEVIYWCSFLPAQRVQ